MHQYDSTHMQGEIVNWYQLNSDVFLILPNAEGLYRWDDSRIVSSVCEIWDKISVWHHSHDSISCGFIGQLLNFMFEATNILYKESEQIAYFFQVTYYTMLKILNNHVWNPC